MASMGQGVMTATVEGVIDYINPAYAHMLGFEPASLIGKTALDFTHPDDQPKLIRAQMQNLEGQSSSYEACLIKADGLPLYVLVNSVPHYDPQGKIIGSIATITDLTERRAAESQIKTDAEEINEIYQAAIQLFKATGVKELAAQIAEITVNELGFDSCGVLLLEEPIKLNTARLNLEAVKNDNHLIWLARHGRFYNTTTETIPLKGDGLVAAAVRQGEIIYASDVTQEPRYLPDSTYTQSELVIPLRAYNLIIGAIDLQSPQLNGFDERARRIINVFAEHAGLALETVRLYDKLQEHAQALETQMNEREKIEKALRASSVELNAANAKLAKALRAKDEFLANMSHELRTPLNAILGKSEILQEGIHGQLTEKQASSLQVIEQSGRHLLELINDILDMAKIEAEKVTLDIQTVPLDTLCESSLQFVRQMAHKKQIKLQASIDHSLTSCQGDERRLKQILINLLSNAVKFTPAEGEVGLNILNDAAREAVQFQVWDTGIGIAAEDMDKLFKPFVQLDSSLARSHDGTGLGLSLVHRLTELHGGTISVESQVGVGSCFTVTLPQNFLNNPGVENQSIHHHSHNGLNHHYLPGEEKPNV
jgi:PAS domain S-box-containing protein